VKLNDLAVKPAFVSHEPVDKSQVSSATDSGGVIRGEGVENFLGDDALHDLTLTADGRR